LADDAGKRSGALYRAADWLETFLEVQHVWVALAAALLLALLQLPGVEALSEKAGLDRNPELATGVGAIVLASILLEMRQLRRRVTPVASGRKQYPEPGVMYKALTEKAQAITEREHREIEVLGLTLYSAWNQLSIFLELPEVSGWTVRLAALSEDDTFQQPWVPDGWPEESATTLKRVREFSDKQGEEHDHTIEVFEYEFAPAVHGFRLGNGDVFVSTLLWLPEGRLGSHPFSYDYIPVSDLSPGANAARKLFENWFNRAVRSSSTRQEADPDRILPEGGAG
jgi:hypothetical protein